MSVAQELLGLLKLRVLRLLALIALVVGVGIECFITKLAVLDPDIWWHLSVGNWIVHNHAFPHNGIFSQTAANRPWMAYSWGYEVLLSRAYDLFSFMPVVVQQRSLARVVRVDPRRIRMRDLRKFRINIRNRRRNI